MLPSFDLQDGNTFETSSQGQTWKAAAAEFKALLSPGAKGRFFTPNPQKAP